MPLLSPSCFFLFVTAAFGHGSAHLQKMVSRVLCKLLKRCNMFGYCCCCASSRYLSDCRSLCFSLEVIPKPHCSQVALSLRGFYFADTGTRPLMRPSEVVRLFHVFCLLDVANCGPAILFDFLSLASVGAVHAPHSCWLRGFARFGGCVYFWSTSAICAGRKTKGCGRLHCQDQYFCCATAACSLVASSPNPSPLPGNPSKT